MATETEIAWAAGLFEGEGCVSTSRGAKSLLTNGRAYPRMTLGMTDEDVVREFHRIVGTGNVRARAPKGFERKVMFYWQASCRPALRAAVLLRPFLGARRAARMDEVFDLWWA